MNVDLYFLLAERTGTQCLVAATFQHILKMSLAAENVMDYLTHQYYSRSQI